MKEGQWISAALTSRSRRRRRQGGQEMLEFGIVCVMFVPLLLGMFVTGMNLIMSIQAKSMVRDMADMYIHGADFSSYGYQQVAQRIAGGLKLQFPTFGSGINNVQSNLGTTGNGVVWVTQVMYVGTSAQPQCTAVLPATCTNASKFVFLQRIVFGNSNLIASPHVSFLGDPTGATLSATGAVSNYLTDANAQLASSQQSAMQALWNTAPSPQTPLSDGQILYVVEGYFSTPGFSMGSTFNSQGVYARYFF
jgi:hypothetical protein